jgi:hypothetical protein
MPYLIAALMWAASVGGALLYGIGLGEDRQAAKQAEVQQAIRDTREQAQQGAAEAISKLRPQYTTIHQELQREVRTNTVYSDCKLPAVGLRIANDALAGRSTQRAGEGELPRADAAGGKH